MICPDSNKFCDCHPDVDFPVWQHCINKATRRNSTHILALRIIAILLVALILVGYVR